MSSYTNISQKDRDAIDKKELEEFEQRRVRGTGYDLMKDRDRGIGWIHDERVEGKSVEIAWPVEDEKRYPYMTTLTPDGKKLEVYSPRIPAGKFMLRIGNEEALIDKEAFQKLFRWA